MSKTDAELAEFAAEKLLETDRQPYCFSINHNVGPPKNMACPLLYDFVYGKTVGIETQDRVRAYRWIEQAILQGYTVSRAASDRQHKYGVARFAVYGPSSSLKYLRMQEEYLARVSSNDDDIPF